MFKEDVLSGRVFDRAQRQYLMTKRLHSRMRMVRERQIQREGHQAHVHGIPDASNPYEGGSTDHFHWAAGWRGAA